MIYQVYLKLGPNLSKGFRKEFEYIIIAANRLLSRLKECASKQHLIWAYLKALDILQIVGQVEKFSEEVLELLFIN